jgi:outer membrane lipoprotein carrier protein
VDPATLPPPKPGSADEMAQRVDDIYQPIRRFHAKFEQTYRAKVAGVTKTSTGHLFVQKPSKLSMRYDPPNNNRVVSDGSIVKVYEADNKQMFTQPVARTEYPGALAFIMGKGLRASFTFVFHEKAKFPGGKVLLGTPRVRNPAYERAFFYIDKALLDQKDPRSMRRVLVLDVQKNRNRFDFTDISQPTQIDASEFAFVPPPGTTMVK